MRHIFSPPEVRVKWGEHWAHKSGWTVAIAANRLKRWGFIIKEANNKGCLYHRLSNKGIRDFHVVGVKPEEKDKITIGLHEKQVYSQNGEDGIIEYLLRQIGTESRQFVEIGCGCDVTNCTSNLSINKKWVGLLMNDKELTKKTEKVVRKLKVVKFVKVQVSPKNVNKLLRQHLKDCRVDVLSIDVDGLDFWIWDAISVIQPRLVIIEYNASFGLRPITVPCINPFSLRQIHESGFYHGASVVALTKLGRRKGYSLVGCDSTGVNAFFVRSDLVGDKLRVLLPEEAYYLPSHRIGLPEEHMSELKKMEFVKV